MYIKTQKVVKILYHNKIYTSEPYKKNVAQSWVGEKTNSVTKSVRTQKGSEAGKETHQKNSCRGSKGPFQMYMAGKKTITKIKLQKHLKNGVHHIKNLLNFHRDW